VVTPILIGVIIYVFFRNQNTLVENLFSFINPNNIKIKNQFISNLPDFLSAYSIHSACILYLKERMSKKISIFTLFVLLFFEFLQLIIDFGTFDLIDVLSLVFAIILSDKILNKNVTKR
tara:strand:+ start:156 stop:512 length:357 start_codon:yes stop_codon:yes gene_type:complete